VFSLTPPWLIVTLAVPAVTPLGATKSICYSPIAPGVKPANRIFAVWRFTCTTG
jgi:hypothetical protein